ncbi:MAG: isoprenylcysteine carboxylmethyltransferase family protein [Candidatus Aceula meridiana]|nr:isoprenylcysteine carboxylmethyltransferase family protein [Candidatus Aceula meridiana]
MKKRIQIDSSILSFAIILTGILYLFPSLYPRSPFWDNICDFIGLMLVLKGTFLRMAARGFKKIHSKKSKDLVTEGPYTLTRNPMYLGSFLMGAGFVLIVWPFWFLPVFAYLFYLRFNKEIVKEEGYLTEIFGDRYKQYCRKVPRLFPKLKKLINVDVREALPLEACWNTKEKRGLFWWPVLAVLLEVFQENIIFGGTDVKRVISLFVFAMAVFAIGGVIRYTLFPKLKFNVKKSKTL